MSITHATLVFERFIPADPGEAFEAYADFERRARWSTPSATAAFIYDEADFREGGTDRFRCGAKLNPDIHGTNSYLAIVPDQLIVMDETITMGGVKLCASLNTIELCREGKGTRLTHTVQIASYQGAELVQGHERGHNAALDNLVASFNRAGH